jgi:hypothetical protein
MAPPDPDLAAALDKMMRSSLDAWSSLWFWILVGSTIAVAIGIIGEAPEVWKEVGLGRKTVARIRNFWYVRVRKIDLNGWEKLCPELITKNDFRAGWIAKAAFTGWLLVAVGVAGEGIAEYFVNDAETGIRAFDEERVAEVTKQAGDAATSAAIAHDEADAAKVGSATARKDAGDAVAKAHAAERSLGKAEADAGKAQTAAANALDTATDAVSRAGKAEASLGKAEAEAKSAETSGSNALNLAQEARRDAASFESDLARLRKQAEDRVLGEYQQQDVASKIGSFLGSPYELGSVDTGEAEYLLGEIDAALSSAGWIYKMSEDKSFRFIGHLRNGKQFEPLHGGHGVEIGLTKALEQQFKPAADALVKALNFEGISAAVITLPDSDPSPHNIHIEILGKP